ncbi:ABC transporter ATP-binding protein [Sedimentibacter saalensis]|jgi:oligopeptide/dipeptide ABC transporter ATP-binding protein|uniref:Oligopeptide transport system ATP-binding protein n=2 Tax=root TaxID=1 RepID=A0A562JEM8_9FIRM|nr:oligopeptide/dipeptide ABC transporter ATP-binding protein [Sedimentibacter saalensis]MEA5095330.1 oligopeptide/dipeptide ABC transporter ATP-binding protein [Sedimentibacter saalensis]TWH81493.1 oligopeptide transport system ATP-binding protein [Sedimentibacter saalensis]
MTVEKQPLIQVQNLSKYFQLNKKETLKAVEDVSFDIYEGETVGLVGESGCGKSTTGRCLVKLYEPTKGTVLYNGKDIFDVKSNEQNLEYCKNTQMIFQNPYSSLNPRMTVKDIVGEGIKLHEKISDKELDVKIESLLKAVGLNRDHMSRFPHEFSGGQRQRIGIARALSVNPKFIVCDEPISALDVSIQAQVLNMLKKLQKDRGLTFLFIAHDLSVVKYISDKVIVMYLGMIVEQADAVELYKNPIHPYTKALLSAIPEADPNIAKNKQRIMLNGEIPSPINPQECCRFAERCPNAKSICRESIPPLKSYGNFHKVACHMI